MFFYINFEQFNPFCSRYFILRCAYFLTDKPWWTLRDKDNPFKSGVLYIKRKVGACSYVDDPVGSQSLLSRAMHKVSIYHVGTLCYLRSLSGCQVSFDPGIWLDKFYSMWTNYWPWEWAWFSYSGSVGQYLFFWPKLNRFCTTLLWPFLGWQASIFVLNSCLRDLVGLDFSALRTL